MRTTLLATVVSLLAGQTAFGQYLQGFTVQCRGANCQTVAWNQMAPPLDGGSPFVQPACGFVNAAPVAAPVTVYSYQPAAYTSSPVVLSHPLTGYSTVRSGCLSTSATQVVGVPAVVGVPTVVTTQPAALPAANCGVAHAGTVRVLSVPVLSGGTRTIQLGAGVVSTRRLRARFSTRPHRR